MTVKTRRIYVAFEGGRAFFAVPLRNVGRGLAVIDPADISVGGEGLAKQPLGCEVQRERVPSGEMTRVLCTYEQASQGEEPKRSTFEMTVPYRDLDESQAFAAVVRVELVTDDQWRVCAVRQTAVGGDTSLVS